MFACFFLIENFNLSIIPNFFLESNGDTTEEAICVAKTADTLNLTSCGQEHDASPKPLSRSKDKRVNRCVPVRQPLTDHINRSESLVISEI